MIINLPNITEIAYAFIIGFSALIHGAIGVGFPIVGTPLLAMLTDVRTAILILVIPTIVINLSNILKGGNWRKSIVIYWPLAVFGIIGTIIGTRLLVAVSPEIFRLFLAIVIIFYLNTKRIGIGFSWVNRSPKLAIVIFGITAGILGGSVNVMLPALIIYALEVKMPKTVMIQVFNLCFLFGKGTQGIVLAHAGLMTKEILWISVTLSMIGLLLMLLGMRIRDRIPTQIYQTWLRRLLVLMAVILLFQFVKNLIVLAL